MKRFLMACFALVLGWACVASEGEYLLWMIDSPSVVKDDVTMTFADFSELNEVNSARVAVSGGDLTGDTYLNIYALNGDNWIVSPSSFVEVDGDGYAGPVWSGLGDYAASTYSFTIELGHYDLTSDVWTLLARSESASYETLYNDWSTASSIADVPGTFEWTGGAYTAVPEPSGGMLFLLGGMILALRRRRSAIPPRVSRPLVALLALGLVFSADAETSTPITVTDAGFTITKSLMPSDEPNVVRDLESALVATPWNGWTDTFDWVAGYTAEAQGDFNFDRSGGENCGFPPKSAGLGRHEQTEHALFHATGTLVVPEAGEWTICLGAQRDSDFNLTISGQGETFTMTEADFDTDTSKARAVKTFNFPAAGEYSFVVDLFRVNNGAFMELSHAKGSVAAEDFSTNAFSLVGKTAKTSSTSTSGSGWRDFKPDEDNVFAGVVPVLEYSGSIADQDHAGYLANNNQNRTIGQLTDGRAGGSDDIYGIGDGAKIVWTLESAEDIKEFRFFTAWTDANRTGVAIESVEVQTNGGSGVWIPLAGSKFRWCVTGESTVKGELSEDGKTRLVRFYETAGGVLAEDVVAVRISFGQQDNYWTGYEEIEAIRCESVTPEIDPAFVPSTDAPAAIAGYTLAWNEEFNTDGAPNAERWIVTNPGNAVCTGGALVLTAEDGTVETGYRYAGLQQVDGEFSFGHYEIRAKMPFGNGIHGAFQFDGSEAKGGYPAAGCLDLIDTEYAQNNDGYTSDTVAHWTTWEGGHEIWWAKDITAFAGDDEEWADKYHVWTIDWDEDAIVLSLDGEVYDTIETVHMTSTSGYSPAADPDNLFALTLALDKRVCEYAVGVPVCGFPQTMKVDYIRYYKPTGTDDPGEDDPGEDDPGTDDPGEEDMFEFVATSWSENDFVPVEDNVFRGLTPVLETKGDAGDFEKNIIGDEEHNIVSEASVDPALLTDGLVTGEDHSGRYAIRDGAQIVWTLAAPADISEFRFYTIWKDNGRAGIAIASIEVQTEGNDQWSKVDGSTFRWCLSETETDQNTITATPSDEKKRCVHFLGKDGGILATDVVAVRISFGVQDNKWSGYAEIEAVGVPSRHVQVVATSTNTFGMATIYSTDTNTIIAVPWTWYSKREEDAGPIYAEKLVSPENLTPGDFLVLLTNAFGNATAKSAGYAAWTLDENLKWQPATTVACAPENGLAHTTILAGASNTVARGYGIWLLRQDPLDTDGAPKPFHVYGQFVSQGATVTVKGGGSRTAPVFTMLADPYLREVKVNEDIAWGDQPDAQDSLAIVTDQTTFLYCKWDKAKKQWWYSEVTYDETKGQNVTKRITDIRVPAGTGFWYVRRTTGDFTVTWGDNQ